VERLGIIGDGELRIPAEMKALILTGRMVQDDEYKYPWHRLREAGYEVHVATKDKKSCLGWEGCKVDPTHSFDEIKADAYELLIIPGGVKCMEHMRLERGVIKFIADFHASGKVIGCICSGAFLLISAGLCKGRKIATYPAWKEDVENAGGTFVNDVVVDDRIVTAPHYNVAGKWMAAVLKEAKRA
jgi:protease I